MADDSKISYPEFDLQWLVKAGLTDEQVLRVLRMLKKSYDDGYSVGWDEGCCYRG